MLIRVASTELTALMTKRRTVLRRALMMQTRSSLRWADEPGGATLRARWP
jgi:hypothetical protein